MEAQACPEHIRKPNTTREHELWSAVRDAMTIGHDRGFKRLGWFFKNNCPTTLDMCIRIYDYEECQSKQFVTVYQYSIGADAPLPNMGTNFLVVEKHYSFHVTVETDLSWDVGKMD